MTTALELLKAPPKKLRIIRFDPKKPPAVLGDFDGINEARAHLYKLPGSQLPHIKVYNDQGKKVVIAL